ncbi:nitrate/nitrite transporter NrtS [Candidatus Sulfurimonas marisnigri]|nr:nitrate/nitrite transporter NrtS [Candidatus Sulfurimonas marisnigri]
MKYFKIYGEIVISPNVINRALKVSLIVGTILNLINQGETLVTLDIANLNFIKLGLTYLVPYGVTTYTATAMKVEFLIGTKAIIDADLKCVKCGCEIHVKKNELIPECKKCGIKTHWKLK